MGKSSGDKNVRTDCPRYVSRKDAKQYGKIAALPGIPADLDMFWCGYKGNWIKECERRCEWHVYLKTQESALKP